MELGESNWEYCDYTHFLLYVRKWTDGNAAYRSGEKITESKEAC